MVAAAIVMAPLIRTLISKGAGGAADWLRNNEELVDEVLNVAVRTDSSPVKKAAIAFLQWLSTRAGGDPSQLPPPAATTPLPLNQAQSVYRAMTVAAQISGAEPGRMVELKNNTPRLLPPERRVAIGITRYGGQEVPFLLLAVPNAKAVKLAQHADPGIQIRCVGQASSPNASRIYPPTVPHSEHRPGRSIAHCDASAGSLGAYVSWLDERSGRSVTGFLGASHVMGLLGRAKEGDYVHSPGYPDKDRNIQFRYGCLFNARHLVHVEDSTTANAFVNDCDTAVARLTRKCHPRNVVPGADPDGPVAVIERVLREGELRNFHGDVYLIGRTTPRGKGRFLGTNFSEFLVEMPDNREYLFGQGLAAIESEDPEVPFSLPGDSGGIVYGFQGATCVALGFVIGAAGRITYISPAERCLKTMEVDLLGA